MSKSNKLVVCASVVMITTVAFFVLISPRTSAGTLVGGYIDGDTSWTHEGSPYWVTSDVIVRNGANLSIEVGVDILFRGFYNIYVEEGGLLWLAWTNQTRPYTLFSWDSNRSAPYPGCWRAIQFNASSYDYSSIQYSVIEYATYGVRLESASPTIQDSTIRNCTYGIYSNYGCPAIVNNTIMNCVEDGIYIVGNDPSGGYANIVGNVVYNNTKRGIVFYDVSNARLRQNRIFNNSYNFGVWADTLSEFDHDIDTTNTVNQKPIYYWRNHEHDDEAIPSNAGYVGIVNSTNITVKDLTLTHNGQGVLVAYSNYTTINNVTAADHELGAILFSSPNNTIINSNISNNDHNGYYQGASGMYLKSSPNNNITNNIASWNILNGTYLFYSDDNNLSDNTLMSNNIGITIVSGSNNVVQNNTLNSNQKIGIYLSGSGANNNDVNNNTVSNSDYGIFVSANSNNISYNLVSNCKGNWGYGIYLGHVSVWANIVNNNNASNNNYGITIRGSSANTIRNNIANSNTFHGIYVRYDPVSQMESQYNVILNNSAIGNGAYGIYLEGDGMDKGYNTVSNNTAKSNNAGIVLSQILYNNITLNDVNSNNNYGITLGTSANYNNVSNNNIYLNPQGIRVAQTGYNNITYNKFYNNDFGIYLFKSEKTNISYNNISSNNYDGIYITTDDTSDEIYDNTIAWNNRTGINSSSSSEPIIKSNDIENNTWYGVWSGGGSDPTIEDNTISYNTQGIYCVDYSSPTITWNDIHNNTDAGVNCTSGSNPVIHYNNIEDNLKDLNDPESGYGVNNRDPIQVTIDAKNNWWGHDTGPYHSTNPTGQGNQVSNGVNFDYYSGQPY